MTDAKARFFALATRTDVKWRHTGNDWDAIEVRLGLQLPSDFKWLIGNFGAFSLFGYVGIYSPFDGESEFPMYRALHTELIERRRQFFPELPDPEAFLAFASDDNSDFLVWEMYGAPDAWKVAYVGASLPRVVRFNMGALELLLGLAEGNILFPFWHGAPLSDREGPIIRP